MRTPAEKLEPAVRDPRKLRNTALILTAIMIASAIGILFSYFKMAERQADDDTPSFKGRLDKSEVLKVWRQDQSEGDLGDLEKDVYLIAPILFNDPARWQQTRGVLERLAKRYADRKDFHIVCLSIDPEKDSPLKLGDYAKDLGAMMPQWWLAATREESTHKFLKNVLRMQIYPHKKDDGTWDYDSSLILIDRDRHIRQATQKRGRYSRKDVTFDFEEAATWDAQGRTEGLKKSNVETLEEILVKTIDQLLAKPVTQP